MIPTHMEGNKVYVDFKLEHPDDRFRLNDNRDAERYKKLKTLCWAVIRNFQDRARHGEDFDQMVDSYEAK